MKFNPSIRICVSNLFLCDDDVKNTHNQWNKNTCYFESLYQTKKLYQDNISLCSNGKIGKSSGKKIILAKLYNIILTSWITSKS